MRSVLVVESFDGIRRDLEIALGLSPLTKPPRSSCQNLRRPVSFVLSWEIRLSVCGGFRWNLLLFFIPVLVSGNLPSMGGFKILKTEMSVVRCVSRFWKFCTEYPSDMLRNCRVWLKRRGGGKKTVQTHYCNHVPVLIKSCNTLWSWQLVVVEVNRSSK